MKIFKKFYFEKYEFDLDNKKAHFYYSFDESYFFEEIIDLSNDNFFIREKIDLKVLDNMLFHIHIALWISYYKSFPTQNLYIKSGYLDDFQIDFWKKFYSFWLWEFLFLNNLDHNWLFNFKNLDWTKKEKINFTVSEKSLIPIWWWKDSLVSIDLFEKNSLDFDLYVFWKNDSIKQNCADIIWKEILLTKRIISKNLIELNNFWNYNWHVPITGIISFVMILVWYLYNYKYLVLSNEKSANFWNTDFNWLDVNHQYSKSLNYEKDFSEYISYSIWNQIKYFSLLRWFYEIKIAEYFSENCKKYFKVFSSCNNNFQIEESKRLKNKIWCNNCPKCCFVFSILRPFLSKSEILNIFWEDLFYKKDLEKTFIDLLWIWDLKPFECVWEEEEVIYWFYKSMDLYEKKPDIFKIFEKKILNKYTKYYFDSLEKKFAVIYNDDIIPKEIKDKILNK